MDLEQLVSDLIKLNIENPNNYDLGRNVRKLINKIKKDYKELKDESKV